MEKAQHKLRSPRDGAGPTHQHNGFPSKPPPLLSAAVASACPRLAARGPLRRELVTSCPAAPRDGVGTTANEPALAVRKTKGGAEATRGPWAPARAGARPRSCTETCWTGPARAGTSGERRLSRLLGLSGTHQRGHEGPKRRVQHVAQQAGEEAGEEKRDKDQWGDCRSPGLSVGAKLNPSAEEGRPLAPPGSRSCSCSGLCFPKPLGLSPGFCPTAGARRADPRPRQPRVSAVALCTPQHPSPLQDSQKKPGLFHEENARAPQGWVMELPFTPHAEVFAAFINSVNLKPGIWSPAGGAREGETSPQPETRPRPSPSSAQGGRAQLPPVTAPSLLITSGHEPGVASAPTLTPSAG